MEMHEIRYFLAACQTLNFHRAAELVHVGQPALTRAIQKLEGYLGGYLFRREKGSVQLTDFGCLMRTHLEDVFKRSESARRTAKSFLTATSSLPSSKSSASWFAAPSISVTSIPGCRSRKAFRKPMKRIGPIVHMTPSVRDACSSARRSSRTVRSQVENRTGLYRAFRPRVFDRPSI